MNHSDSEGVPVTCPFAHGRAANGRPDLESGWPGPGPVTRFCHDHAGPPGLGPDARAGTASVRFTNPAQQLRLDSGNGSRASSLTGKVPGTHGV